MQMHAYVCADVLTSKQLDCEDFDGPAASYEDDPASALPFSRCRKRKEEDLRSIAVHSSFGSPELTA